MKLSNLYTIFFIAFSMTAFAENPPNLDDEEIEIREDEEEGSEEVDFEVRAVLDFPPAPRFDENAIPNYEDDAPGAPRARRQRAPIQQNHRVARRRLDPAPNAAAAHVIAQLVAGLAHPPAFRPNAGARSLF